MNNFMPIHHQIADFLRKAIESGEYKPGDRLPTEKELEEKFNTSKSPIRQALDALRFEGLIFRHPGRGTFVASPLIQEEGWALDSIEDLIGLAIHTKFVLQDFTPMLTSKEISKAFNVERGEFLRVRGIRYLKNKPMYHVNVYVPQEIGSRLKTEDVQNSGVIITLEKKLKVKLTKCIQSTYAVLADEEATKYLDIPCGSPVLCIERTYYTDNDVVVGWARSIIRSDVFRHRSTLFRKRSRL
jgi:GntR family transcriptional regulator